MHLLYGAGECFGTPLQKTVISSNKHNERKVNYPILISVCIAGIVNLVAMGGGIFITGSFLFYKTVVKSSAQKAMKLSGLVSMRVPK